MKKINYLTEYKREKIISPIPISFYKNGYCEEKEGQIVFKIVGFLISEKEAFVIFPKGINKSDNTIENQKKAQTLFQTLIKYNKNSVMGRQINFGENNKHTNFLSLINWIVNDYKKNGLIQKQFTKKEINGRSKTNWSKTIKETTPYVIKNQVFYLDTVNITTLKNLNNELTAVHYSILKLIEEEYGWLLNIKIHEPPFFLNQNLSFDRMKHILHKALRVTFNQKEIILYKNLIEYLDHLSKAEGRNKFSFLHTQYFQYVWETVCKFLFEHDQSLQTLIPNPYWYVEGEERNSEQIPDILTKDSADNLFVIDAKYYRPYDGIDRLPGWKDIVKQLFYAKSIDTYKIRKMYNIFVFPSDKKRDDSHIFEHGYASVKGKESELGKIISFELNTFWALNCYIQNEKKNSKRQLINILRGLQIVKT
ncbi:LlaJI family restriction endonuclease [Bacillus sp. V3]|nr:LlaJI family restriction endonuclease [Bacillus sp. V3]